MLTNKTLFLILSLSLSSVCLFSPAVQSQSADEDGAGEQSGNETSEGAQHFEDSIEEQKGVRTLEQEYNEHGVDWHSWAEKVAGAVWDPLIEGQAVVCGQSRVHWQVTRDCRVHIVSVSSPIPNGAQALVGSIKSLDRNSVLAFPSDSQKTVVDRVAWVGGKAIMHIVHGPIKVYP